MTKSGELERKLKISDENEVHERLEEITIVEVYHLKFTL